jgi:cyclic-di-GMP phosphodiesterase, flagellum assembly factor TipF
MQLKGGVIVGVSVPVIMACVAYIGHATLGLTIFEALLGGFMVSTALVVVHISQSMRADTRILREEIGDLDSRLATLSRSLVDTDTRLAVVSETVRRAPLEPRPANATDLELLASLMRELAEAVAAHDAKIESVVAKTVAFGERSGEQVASATARDAAAAPQAAHAAAASSPQLAASAQSAASRLPRVSADTARLVAARQAAQVAQGPQAAATVQTSGPREVAQATATKTNAKPVASADARASALAAPSSLSLRSAGAPPVTPAARAVREAIVENTLELFLQPIVTLPQRKTRAYEATLRPATPGGAAITALEVRGAAASAGLSARLDQISLVRAIRLLSVFRDRGREATIFCLISAAGLGDLEVASQLRAVVGNVTNASGNGGLVIALTQSALRTLGPIESETLDELVRSGMKVAMVDTKDLRLDAHDLASRGVRFVRMPGARLMQAAQGEVPGLEIHPADISGLLARHGIDLIIDGISSEQFVLDLLEYSVPFAQGDLFSPPRQVRPEILDQILPAAVQPAVEAAPPPVAIPQSPAAAEERVSFRSLLRRASV